MTYKSMGDCLRRSSRSSLGPDREQPIFASRVGLERVCSSLSFEWVIGASSVNSSATFAPVDIPR
jgi:hypothetical protein